MDNTGQVLVAVLAIALAIALRLAVDRLDRNRIRADVERTGGQVLDISWNPFGPGWFGSRERIYDVSYRTLQGATVNATCKTSMFSGVYWTQQTPTDGV